MEGISVQELISQLRKELFSSPDDNEPPLFFIEKVELELHVDLTFDKKGGLKITAFSFAGANIGGNKKEAKGHVVNFLFV